MTDSTEYFAVIFDKEVHHQGDERSRTHPGHGYPAYTENIPSIQEFLSQEDLLAWVKHEESLTYGKKTYRIIRCSPVTITTTIQVQLS